MNRWIGGGIVVVFLAAGCSDGPRIVQIEGTATRKGQPVPNITVFFMPIIEGRRSWAITDEEGKFKLTNSAEVQGVPVGKHKVSVAFRPKDPKEEMFGSDLLDIHANGLILGLVNGFTSCWCEVILLLFLHTSHGGGIHAEIVV